jgi:hypothetical protein
MSLRRPDLSGKSEFALALFNKIKIKKATNMLSINTLNEVENVSILLIS